jgi:type I restriction enzyme M protein
MWITEPFDVQLNNGNAKKKADLYGDLTFYLSITSPFKADETIALEVKYDGSKAFETLVAETLKKQVAQLKSLTVNEIKSWYKERETNAKYYHRHYIVDNEYIPFDKSAEDKTAYINAFLAREIDYQIIRWKEYDQLGYEILPNKYFYKYQEPISSDTLIEQFWKLEAEAEDLLNQIRSL